MNLKKLAAATLVLALGFGSQPAFAQQAVVTDRAAVDQALSARAAADESSRDAIRTLLGRDDVKEMADRMGLDVRRATNAVSSLEGADLQRVSERAVAANDLLTGGRTTVTISLVALLLIIIIIILVAN